MPNFTTSPAGRHSAGCPRRVQHVAAVLGADPAAGRPVAAVDVDGRAGDEAAEVAGEVDGGAAMSSTWPAIGSGVCTAVVHADARASGSRRGRCSSPGSAGGRARGRGSCVRLTTAAFIARVDREARAGAVRLDRRDVDDRRRPVGHERHAGADEVRDAGEVLADQRVLALVVDVEEARRRSRRPRCSRATSIAPSSAATVPTKSRRRRSPSRTSSSAGDDAAARRLDRVGGGVEVRHVAVADRDVRRRSGRARAAVASPMPDRRAGDDRDAVRQQGGGRVERHGGAG